VLFTVAHFHVLHSIIIAHPTCVFLSLVDDTHIIGSALDVLLDFLQLMKEFGTLRLLMQLTKCVAWSPQGLN